MASVLAVRACFPTSRTALLAVSLALRTRSPASFMALPASFMALLAVSLAELNARVYVDVRAKEPLP
jgi:hypothetical protein